MKGKGSRAHGNNNGVKLEQSLIPSSSTPLLSFIGGASIGERGIHLNGG